MKQTNELIITIKKKDVRRSLNSCQNEHGQILCAFDSRQQPTSVLAYWSNHLSGTKINNFDELQKKINEKITKWKKTKHLNVKDFMLFVAWELQLRASKKNNKYFSYYLDLYENKETIVLRISDHHFDAETEKNHPAKYTTSVTFSNEKPEDWDYFKADPNVNAVEYVYYEDKVTKDDLISIAKDIIEFVETGKFTPSVKPNEINESPKPTDNNLSGNQAHDTTLQKLELQLLSNEIIPDHKELKERIDVLKNRLADRITQRPRLFINKQAYQRWQAYTRKIQKQIDKLESLLRIESLTKNFSEDKLGSLISEPTKQTFYENLYKQLESIVKNDSFEKNGIRNFILSHIPEDYKNDDIEGIVEVFYQRLRALKCSTKGLGAIHKFNIGDTIKMTSGVTAKIIDFIDGDKYKIEFDDTVAGRKKIAIYFWKLEEKAVLSDDYNVGDLVSYKGFEETIFQIVGFKRNNYIVVELGDRTRTKNEIPFADKDKLQKAVSPLLVKEMELEKNNLGNIVEELQPSGLSGFEAITKYIESTMQNGGTTDNRQIRTVCEQNGINLDEHITKVKEAVEIGLMHVARNIAQSDKPLRQKYDELIDLYNRQPYVGTKKTLKQMVLQQYSTPLPIAFLMSEFVKNKSNSSLYFEPSAGNGFLTISLPQENTICNEIDRYRLENLKNEHYRKVSEQDARQPFEYSRIFDGVVTNPPFLKGQETNAMIFNALETMKDSGRCAILRDGNAQFTEYAGTKLRSSFTGFYDKLFQEYNVVKIININAKKIYAKQGTSFFMHIILINGRRANKLSDDDSMHRVYNPEIDKIELAGFEELWEYFLPYFIDETTYYYYSLANKSKLLFKELELTIEVGDEFVKEKQLSWKQKSKIDYWLRTNKVKDKEIFDFYYVSNINKNGDIYLFNEQNDITNIYTRKEFYELGLQFYKHYKPKGLGNLEPDFVKYQNFIKKSLENKHYKDELDCTELVSEYNRNKASNMLNKEITKFYLISDDIRHLQKHSKDNEYKKGQIPLTMSDFLRIPEILSNPDELLLPQSNPKNGQGIAFIKTFADGKQYCILIDKYEDGELSPKTGYKKPLRGLNGFYSVHDRCPAKQSPNLTSVTPKVPRRFVAKITNFFVITK